MKIKTSFIFAFHNTKGPFIAYLLFTAEGVTHKVIYRCHTTLHAMWPKWRNPIN